ncbi:E3 ubiquitin-protein ligase ORTHRUS 2 [Cajanus cajan]|uniref:E3 ubiquitin-protein ligase ORTHRUS 2 n=1 Tax=Cajanus cajan TaxID=3821 RepID=UPI00098DB114|nr:E3 ubiquitin-protein ligase ORTHRUS 2 [Cajanus cajan]
MASQPRINSALVFAIRMARAASNNNGGSVGVRNVNHFRHNQDRPDEPFTTERAQRNGRANAASGKIFVTVPTDHFGPITAENDPVRNQGLLVGESWRDRLECRQWGCSLRPCRWHCWTIRPRCPIGCSFWWLCGRRGSRRVVSLHRKESGGKDLSGNKRTNKSHSFDQKFEKYNRALQVSCLQGYPVRVVRSHKEKRSSYAPENGVRYDGIYRIEKCWQIAGLQGFKVCRYLFVRCDNEPAPWTSDDHGDRPRPLPVIRELKKATVIFERTETPSWDFDEEDSLWKWKKPPPPSRQKVRNAEPVEVAREKSNKDIRKFQLKSIKEQLQRGFSCMICGGVMVSPVTTPCAHNFCKSCLEGAFAGQTFVRERSRGGRTLRSQKNVMKCPSCTIDISDYLQNIQVDVDLKSAIESLKAKVEEIGESVESSENADELQDDGAGKDEDTDSGNKNSEEDLNGLHEGSDVGELKDANKGPDLAVKCNAKRKKGDCGKESPADKMMEKRGKKYRKTEEAVNEENDSPSSPLP